ncbi:MAG: helix-turn-helix domain-containing protein [Prolixibacteraceae bacterium]|nr:helix-turn-helix domain-containing protein [Prolixibacteraceae bacterium]
MINESNDQHWKVLVLLVKEIAKEKKITHKDIAEKTGMKASSISRIFSLRYRVTLANFIAIAQAVGVNFYFEAQDSKTDLPRCSKAGTNNVRIRSSV